MTWLISDEARKHRAFREVWVAYLLGGLYLLLGLYTEISEQNYSALYDAQQKWLFVQQNIYSYGATLTAFLLAVGLPRLVCCEKEYRTDDLVGTAALGRRCTWRAKTAFTVLYCVAVVFIIGAASLLAACGGSSDKGGSTSTSGAEAPNSTGAVPLKEFISFESGNRELESWNILYTQKAEDANVITNLWDGLLSFDCYGKVVPAIASSWEHNDDSTVWTFHLRDDVDWVDVNGEVKDHLTSKDFLVGFEWS